MGREVLLRRGGPQVSVRRCARALPCSRFPGSARFAALVYPNCSRPSSRTRARAPPCRAVSEAFVDLDTKKQVATALGYTLSLASVLLYMPVALRVTRQKQADGLTLSTWWFKAAGFGTFLIYALRNNYPAAQFGDTAVLTFESVLVLAIVAYYKEKPAPGFNPKFLGGLAALAGSMALGATVASMEVLRAFQVGAVFTQKGALLPQIKLNQDRKGCDYSPVSSGLAFVGSSIKIFTTMELANGDPLLLLSFTSGALLNLTLLLQALYFGTVEENKTIAEIFKGDFSSDWVEEEEEAKEEHSKNSLAIESSQRLLPDVKTREETKAKVTQT